MKLPGTFNVQRSTHHRHARGEDGGWTLRSGRLALGGPPVPRPSRAAFTLLEILLVLAVSAIVLSVITTVYFNALNLRNRTAASFEEILPLQHAVTVLKRDLAGILPPGGPLAGELQSSPSAEESASMNLISGGEPVTPVLHTDTGIIAEYSPFADVQKVSYYLVAPTNQNARGRDLIRVVSANLLPAATEEATSRWIMGGVDSLRLQFYDGTSWIETWDSAVSTNLPAAIKVRLVLAADDGRPNEYDQEPIEIVVPLLMQARVTPSPSTGGGE